MNENLLALGRKKPLGLGKYSFFFKTRSLNDIF